MSHDDERPADSGSSLDDRWKSLVDEYSHPDTAQGGPGAPEPESARVWPRNLALALLAAGAAFGVVTLTGGADDDPESGATTATASAPSFAPPPVSVSAPAAASGRPGAGTAAGERPMIPLADVFPAEVAGASGTTFTRVGASVVDSCTEPGEVGARLAALIEAGAGCVGEQVALYKDDQDNQFNLAVFTMKDPLDTVKVVTRLSAAFDDYQVAAQAPPPGSGLPTLPADSALVQAFSGYARVMTVGMGQWADGRSADLQQLVDRLGPLQDAVADKVTAYEGTG
ncbi:hypothetical protein OHT52_03825 [Streptomyces sp. NBC_00247]|uniref:hypothetical protein n=1 Tax=Streptomyces sp. NBC_00247 TaxID=2975689 RepID=UPI002E28C2DC|nr:hypothetical protein [Streptomyces sp. NBC_00247]